MFAPLTLPDLSLRLTPVIHTLCRIIAARAGRDRAVAPLALLTWRYLMRLTKRFDALVRRVRAGETAPPRSRTRADAAPRPQKPRLPEGFAWLIRRIPEAAQIGGQVWALLKDPEFAALLTEVPQAGKLLRPLCRMLGIEPSPDLPPALFNRPTPPPTPAKEPPAPDTNPAPPAGPSPAAKKIPPQSPNSEHPPQSGLAVLAAPA